MFLGLFLLLARRLFLGFLPFTFIFFSFFFDFYVLPLHLIDTVLFMCCLLCFAGTMLVVDCYLTCTQRTSWVFSFGIYNKFDG